jgi:hypothetical protein
VFPPIAFAQGKLVFAHGPGALVNELWVANDDGTAQRRLLTMPGPIEAPRWSRDGSRIAFISGDQLWMINEDGTNQQLLNPHVSGVGLSWNAAGTGLIYGAFCTCCEYLRAMDADGTNDQLFFSGRYPIRNIDARPSDTNPQGLVAYRHTACGEEQDRSQGFYGVELTRQFGVDFLQIPGSTGVTRQFLPRWSPDGSLIATAILLGGNTADWAIEILDPDASTAPRTRILQGPGEFGGLDFGSRADKLFFTRETDNFQNIHRVNSDGTGLIQITNFTSGFIRELDHVLGSSCSSSAVGNLILLLQELNGTPIGGASVDVVSGPSQTASSVGKADFCLDAGIYTVQVSAAGFQSASFTATVLSGLPTPVSLTLVPVAVGTTNARQVPATADQNYDTGIDVMAGDSLVLTAAGIWGYGPVAPGYPLGPDGIWGCNGGAGWTLGLFPPCGGLAARIGNGNWFYAGPASTIAVAGAGRLYLSINDLNGVFWDNVAQMGVTIQVIPSGPAPPGRPTLSARAVGKGRLSPSVLYIDLQLSNTGTADAQNIRLTQFQFRTLNGTGTVSYNSSLSGNLPLTVGYLQMGASMQQRIYLNVPSTVVRFVIGESGTTQDLAGRSYSFSLSQSVIP